MAVVAWLDFIYFINDYFFMAQVELFDYYIYLDMNIKNSSEHHINPTKVSNGITIARSIEETEGESSNMSDAEVETSGLQRRNGQVKTGLPDGSKPIILGSGTVSGILGEGGAAVLYEIRNKDLGFHRAVKLLRPNHNKESLERFIKEFKVCAQLTHPNMPVVHTVGQWHGLPFIEMEKVTGFSLSEMITKFAPVPLGLVTAIGIIICKSLEYIHSCKYEIDKREYRGFLHLDLKPSNIMLSDAGVLKIMDFGMATPLQEAKEGQYPGSSIGSSQYVAPEILFGRTAPDIRSDIFSLGCILFELACGIRVFSGSSLSEIMSARKNHSIPSLKKFDKSLPDSFIKLVETCLSFDKDQRPDQVINVRHSLEKLHRAETGATAEDVILLYVTKRKQNEPFEIPAVRHAQAIALYTSGAISALCAGALTFLIIWKPMEFKQVTFSTLSKVESVLPFLKKSHTPLVINSSDESSTPAVIKTVVPVTESVHETIENDFYEPSLTEEQNALLDSLRHKWNTRQFDELRAYIDGLPKEMETNKEVVLYKLRSMGRSGEDLGLALKTYTINDGEYYFHKARYLSGKNDFRGTLESLTKAESLPCEFLDKRILATEVQLYRARSLTALFRENPTSENLKSALEAWDKLTFIVQNRPNSIQAKEAEREKKNLTSEASWRGLN